MYETALHESNTTFFTKNYLGINFVSAVVMVRNGFRHLDKGKHADCNSFGSWAYACSGVFWKVWPVSCVHCFCVVEAVWCRQAYPLSEYIRSSQVLTDNRYTDILMLFASECTFSQNLARSTRELARSQDMKSRDIKRFSQDATSRRPLRSCSLS